ncbi:hypothetical protein E3T46_00755 [Cryobacterium sp. Hh11]|uniref:hypothetical protein n=1 Tax=Cryobacterium sp. Hh11 TaxID=2555868 RepID=UPI001068F1A9|nr:hypothetical protein [Cryobacterium sp. Hh11]TFD54675.1 hypothetical protein E3T46_00755 [Cryobacterium sp. Hh11]
MLILDCAVNPELLSSEHWAQGPLCLTATVRGELITADAPTRRTFFQESAGRALYGGRDSSGLGGRWHRACQFPTGIDGATVVGMEVLEAFVGQPAARGERCAAELILHITLSSEGSLAVLNGLHHSIRTRAGRAALVQQFENFIGSRHLDKLPQISPATAISLSPDDRMYSVYFGEVAGDGPDARMALELATLTPSTTREASEQELDSAQSDLLRSSTDWIGLIRRDGAAFLAKETSNFSPTMMFYARTIYTDTLALGRLQSRLLGILSSRLSEAALVPVLPLHKVQSLEHDIVIFRAAYVTRSISGSQTANDIMYAYQDQHDLNEALSELHFNSVELARAATLKAAALAQFSAARTNAALGVLTVVGLPLGVALTIWSSFDGGLWQLGTAFLGALGSSGLALVSMPGLRDMFRALFVSEE